jgi:catechol 2,3-dioxygenase-like lactoylglutathione lyase family enzyme
MPNLQNLRKQAKLYLRWHRERYHPVAAQIRAVLPRFRNLTDRQILDGSFKLGDAQELVARQSGFANWQALRSGVHAMTAARLNSPARPELTSIEAQLFVTDIAAACSHYRKLGFQTVFVYGEPPFYGQVRRGAARLNFRMICEPVFVGDIRVRETLLAASITVDSTVELKALYDEFQAAGVGFHQALKQQPWGARDFIVLDPDGNLLQFAGPAT